MGGAARGTAPAMGSPMPELEVCGLGARCPGGQPTAALVRPRDSTEAGVLALEVGAGDAHALRHELHGQATPRSQALDLAGHVARALGGSVVSARLVPDGPERLRAELEVAGPGGTVRIPATPGQALGVALSLRVPLLGHSSLFRPTRLNAAIAAFLETLDFSHFQGPRP